MPAGVSAHACERPTAIEANDRFPLTGTGTSLDVVVPVPSCPLVLSPQQEALLLDVTAHVVDPPAEIFRTVRPPATEMGTALHGKLPPYRTQVGDGDPTPSCPRAFEPQQDALPVPPTAQT